MAQWTVKDNILPQVSDEIRRTCFDLMTAGGEVFRDKARAGCPVSAITTKGYVHLIDTIDYNVSQFTSFYLVALTMFVVKYYAEFVNNGARGRPGRPFFTDGVHAVAEQWDETVERVFANLRAGRYKLR